MPVWVLLAALCPVLVYDAVGQDAAAADPFAADSLRYRTALHYDPLLDPPLESLVKLYVGAERTDELIGLYRGHVEQYPDDAGAKTVLIRILRRVDRSGADELIASAVPLHPEFAPLQYVLFRFLEERGDPRALEALSRAIDLETNATRRNDWLDQLLQLTEGDAARALAQSHFDKLLAPQDLGIDVLLDLARLMQRYQFWQASVAALNRAKATKPDPETEIEVEILLAGALGHLGNRVDAGKMLDALLTKLGPGHWRRREVLGQRVAVLTTPEERAALLATLEKVYRENPTSESAILDYASVLAASERKKDAVTVLVESAARLPKSGLVETATLELFEESVDLEGYVRFLASRLEATPERIDLRFRLVKGQYALGRDAAAEQDFKAVVAGLTDEEVSTRILELQRYLRGIERVDAAAAYLERYVRNHPTRLDVARELAEIRLAAGKRELIGELVRWLNPAEAGTETVLDFSEFLLGEGLIHPARVIVEAKLAAEPKQFELGLRHVEILGKSGDAAAAVRQIATFREISDTAPRYARWLEASIAAHRSLETLPAFFDSELNRYSFDDAVWPEEKVEKFLILCEAGKRQLLTTRVAEGLRRQISQTGLEAGLRLRLRKMLVAVLEPDPVSATEVEEQLKLLTSEDPTHAADYDLRRVLVYDRSQRVDLAQALVSGIDFSEITSAPLLREATDLLVGYGFLREAESALASINRIEPEDLLSWERRLSVLVALGEEQNLRAVIRSLRSGAVGKPLRDLSNHSLDEHLVASYWRSIAALSREGSDRLGEALPLITSAEREAVSAASGLWSEWTRAYLLTRLGQPKEAAEALERFRTRAAERSLSTVPFPDGLELSVEAAGSLLAIPAGALAPDEGNPSVEFLLENPVLRWAFELPEGSSLLRMGRGEGRLLVLDDRGQVHSLETSTGKLVWSGYFGGAGDRATLAPPTAFDAVSLPGQMLRKTTTSAAMAKLPPPFLVSGDRFFLMRGNELGAFSTSDGSVLWTAPIPTPAVPSETRETRGARPGWILEAEDTRVILFQPAAREISGFDKATGKMLWHTSIARGETSASGTFSLNTGLSLAGGLGFAYGEDSAIVDLTSGKVVWRLGGEKGVPSFPIVLRPSRGVETSAQAPSSTDAGETPQTDADAVAGDIGTIDLFDFQAGSDAGALTAGAFLGGSASLLSPALFWAKSRGLSPDPAFALLSTADLWLMQGRKVRRISRDLPIASRELAVSGSLIGRSGDHLWFLDGDALLHADFSHDRVVRSSVRDLGDPARLRATVVGNQLLLRGETSLRVHNAITGQILGQAPLPAALIEYLSGFSIDQLRIGREKEGAASSPEVAWQGRIRRSDPASAGVCLPLADVISGNQYHTTFGDGIVVCLEAPPAKPATPAAPAAPAAPAPR